VFSEQFFMNLIREPSTQMMILIQFGDSMPVILLRKYASSCLHKIPSTFEGHICLYFSCHVEICHHQFGVLITIFLLLYSNLMPMLV